MPAPDPPSPDDPERHIRAWLWSALQGEGWQVEAGAELPAPADLVARRGDQALSIELKVARGRARREVLRGLLADGILRARAAAQASGSKPVALLFAPAISAELADELEAYFAEVAPDLSWGLIDGRGRCDLHGQVLAGVEAPDRPSASHAVQSAAPSNPFSDLGQWFIKVLLARDLSPELLAAPRAPARNASALAELAEVSNASVSWVLGSLKTAGHLARDSRELRLVRIEALLQAWRRSVQRPAEQWWVRPLLPGGDA